MCKYSKLNLNTYALSCCITVIPLSHRMRWQHGALRQRPPQPAANVRVGNAEHRVGTAAIRRRPQSVSKKLNMFNFCRRFLRWILHRVDTVVLPQTPCLHRVCTAEYREEIKPTQWVVRLHFCHQFLVLSVQRSSQQPLPDPKLLGLTSSCPCSICFVSCISCLHIAIRPAPE